jgi:predicted ATP-dependent endonuclease of OLD family
MSVKINSLEFENVKRIKAVQLAPAKNGLTVIGGDNKQGKTSVLDAIAWALGGDRFKPSKPQRDGSVIEPHLKVTLDNGIVVERSGKNSSLKVIDPSGNKGGQQLLNSFVEQLALDLPKFMNQSSREKADTLLKIIGVGEQLYKLEQEEQLQFNRRTEIGRIADQKAKFAKEMPVYTDVPAEPLSVSELIQQQQEILAHNGINKQKREQLDYYTKQLEIAKQAYDHAKSVLDTAENNFKLAKGEAEGLEDEPTEELEANIAQIEQINEKVRANLEREKAEIEAEGYQKQYDELTEKVEAIRQAKKDLLKGADLPLDGLTVENSELLYNGQKWDCMSSAEQLIVATSIVRKLNPECGFVLLDKLEQLDSKTLTAFGKWLEGEGLQAIATRVSSGEECAIIIEDGMSVSPKIEKKEYKAGVF